jgi:GNAT superfamily N-acetyltransferase
LFFANPHGRARAVLIRSGDRLVGQAALIPVRFQFAGGGARLGYFVVDVLTHPEYRNMKLFSRIIEAAMEFVRGEGALLMGHPNKAALRGWQRKSMQFQPSLRPRAMFPLIAGGRTLVSRDDVLAAWPDVEQRMSESCSIPELIRSSQYVDWRFYQRPDKSYRVALRLDRHGVPVAFHATTPWRYGIHLLVDHWTDGRRALATPVPTLAMLPTNHHTVANAVRLPLSREVPYFVTDPVEQVQDLSRVTLAASDF